MSGYVSAEDWAEILVDDLKLRISRLRKLALEMKKNAQDERKLGHASGILFALKQIESVSYSLGPD